MQLLSWVGKQAKRVENTVNNDVVKPVVQRAQGAVAQVNPLDGGKTYNTTLQKGFGYAPNPVASALNQVTHNGATNLAGSFAKPLLATPLEVSNQIYNRGIAPAFNLPKQTLQQTPLKGAAHFTGATGSLGKTIGDTAQTAITLGTAGLAPVVERGLGLTAAKVGVKVLPKIISKSLTGAITGGIVGGPFQQAAATSAGQPLTLKNVEHNLKTGAKYGAALGTAGELAPFAAKGALKVAKPAAKATATTAQKAVNPHKFALDQHYQQLQKSYDVSKTQTQKNVLNKLMAQNRSDYRGINEGGYAKIPGKPAIPNKSVVISKAQPSTVQAAKALGQDVSGFNHTIDNYAVQHAMKDPNITPEDIANIPHIISKPDHIYPGGKTKQGLNSLVYHKKIDGHNLYVEEVRTGKNELAMKTLNKQKNSPQRSDAVYTAPELTPKRSVESSVTNLPQTGAKVNLPETSQSTSKPIETMQSPVPARQLNTGSSSYEPTSSVNNSIKTRGFTESVKESKNYTPELRQKVQSEYAVVGDQKTIAKTQQFISKNGVDQAHANVLTRLNSTKSPTKQLVNDAGTVMQILDSKGRSDEAQVIHDKLAEHLTNSGQVSQAAGLLLRRSPDGIYHKAVGDLKKAGVEVSPNIDEQLKAHRENIRSTLPDTPERDVAVQQMRQFVSKNIPSSAGDKFFAVWRAGLLTGPRTVAKILTSHGVHLPLETIKDIPAAAIDKGLSYITGQRSLVVTGKGIGQGLKEGAQAGFGKQGYLRSGIDVQAGSNAIEFHKEINFGPSVAGKIASAYANGVGKLHGSLYKPFYGAKFKNSLYSQALAEAKTNGLKGSASKDFVNGFLKNPTPEALDVATKDAENATFQQKTALGEGASNIQKIPVIGKYIAPFTRIPSAIATDLFNYSPPGALKSVYDGIRAARSDEGLTPAAQRQLVQGLGRSITGTAAMAPGVILYQKGLMTFSYPSDPKEQKLWQLQGKTENSVLIGGKWRSLGSLGPFGAILALGGGLAAGGPQAAGEVAVKSIEDQPYVSGISGAVNALNDPTRYVSSLENQYAGSIVPTAVAQIASASDNLARQANGPLDTIKSKIPGQRQSLAPKKNVFGQNVPNGENGPAAPFDPFYSSKALNGGPLVSELQRLNDAGQGTLPSTQPAKNTFDGVKTQLTKPQAQTLGANVGSKVQDLWTQTINFQGYKNLPDDQKQNMLANVLSDTTSAIKEKYAADNLLGQYSQNYSGKAKPLSQKQQKIIENTFDPADYLPKQAADKAYTVKNGVRVKAPKTTTAKTTKAKSTKTKSVSLASYLKAFKASQTKSPKTPAAPHIKVSTSSGPKFKTVSLKQYHATRTKVA